VKRFYETAAVTETEGGFQVALDGKPIRTPGRLMLTLPTRDLADAVAAEWNGQGEEISPAAMPMTRLANTALDRVEGRRLAVIQQIAAYAESDLVCYRADAPDDLVARQAAAWDPLVAWLADSLGVALAVTAGIAALKQDDDAIRAITAAVARHRSFRLTALHAASTACGSVVLGLALSAGRIDAETAWRAALLDELYQAERWGGEAEAERRRAGIRAEIDEAERFFALTAGEGAAA
jgi:chaperone required for assembly of F1-ATPase